ncbi:uncharacterized protein [Apostichopus japonicus]|uniref:uncharacterized protein isoform X1 n=1 Tax=Stichopus japonicus TaxID=307972 RepID=UPI003AB58762
MAEPQILKDKKQILIKALKKKYEIQYNGIKPIPYIQERLYCVDNVFVESGVNASIGGAASHKAVQWERLESYKTIFTDPRMRSNRRIIEGEPGYGKSTLTLQLAYDWCNGVPDSPLYDVEILILLKLRQMGNVTSIYKAIKLYLIPDERRIKIRDIRKIIESCRSVAFQLDGYDEYPGKEKGNDVGRIMMLQMFPEYDVTLTTRYLPKEYVKSNTNRFKLIGFDDAARDEYIRKAVCGNNEQAVAKVKKGLKENVILDDLCQVPLLFSMFSHMTHEREDFQKFKSVTDFFRYMMGCFHHHTRNKAEEYNVERYATMFEANHEELSKVAFEGLSKENQQIVWEKVSLIKRLGEGFYNHHIRVGILVEEEVFVITDGPDTPGKNIKTKTEVSFYHKIFCEWFASFHVTGIAAGVKDPAELEPSLGKMDPFDLQYVFRFACGLNSGAGSNIIEYLKSKKGGDKFAILCILEQSGKFDGIMETVKELCSKRLIISKNDTKLLQRSTIQLLQIASSHDIPICDLVLQFSFNKVQHGDILLKSGLCLPLFSSLEKISINEGSGNLISEDNVIGLLNYGIQSEKFRELWFFNCELPEFIGPGMIPGTAKSRQIKVLWPSHASQLDLQSGEWRKMEQQLIKELKEAYHRLYAHSHPIASVNVKAVNNFFIEGGIEYLVNNSGNVEKWESLENYRSIRLDPRVKSNRRIIEAGPGCGKTALTVQLARDWSIGGPGSSLNDVKVLIVMKICELVEVTSIYECIKQSLQTDSNLTVNNIKEVLRQTSSVLFVLDGVDEYHDYGSKVKTDILAIIEKEMFPHFEVVLTTRSQFVQKRYSKDFKRIRLTGFDRLTQDKYLRKVVTKNDDDATERITESLQDNPILGDLCRVPFFFIIYAHITHDNDMIKRYTTMTGYFRNMISCFHDHFKRKFHKHNQQTHVEEYNHTKLNEVAFESLVGYSTESWTRDYLCTILGHEFFDQYLRIGIFVEVREKKSAAAKLARKVRFNHSLFCEWYAANHVVDVITKLGSKFETSSDEYLIELLEDLYPSDYQHLYRFVCGIYPDVAKHIIHYIRGMEGSEEFTILCLLEQIGSSHAVMETVKELCSKPIHLSHVDSKLLQRSTLQILAIASHHKVTVSRLMLHEAIDSVDVSRNEIVLTSGLRLSSQTTLGQLWIEMSANDWTEKNLQDLFIYAASCENLNSVAFSFCLMPRRFSDVSSLSTLHEKKVQVLWYPSLVSFRLNLQTGCWEHTSGSQMTDEELDREITMCKEMYPSI